MLLLDGTSSASVAGQYAHPTVLLYTRLRLPPTGSHRRRYDLVAQRCFHQLLYARHHLRRIGQQPFQQ